MNSPKFRGVFFDLDGTLIDSMFIWDDLSSNYLKTFGVEPKPDLREVPGAAPGMDPDRPPKLR